MNTTSIKLKFKPSSEQNQKGALTFLLRHGHIVGEIACAHKIYNKEWNKATGKICLPPLSSPRRTQLELTRLNVEWEMQRLREIASEWERSGLDWDFNKISQEFIS